MSQQATRRSRAWLSRHADAACCIEACFTQPQPAATRGL